MKPLLLTPGDPAGIGPEIACRAAAEEPDLVLVADPAALGSVLGRMRIERDVREWTPEHPVPAAKGVIPCLPIALPHPVVPGRPDPGNAVHVIRGLELAADLCLEGGAAGLITGPVNKAVIHAAGIPFTGHTEFLAARAGGTPVVMMLIAGEFRVALVTTHMPLRHVPEAITRARLEEAIGILDDSLRRNFDLSRPVIAVLGLNPHAGEDGALGTEEIEIIRPALERMRARGIQLEGPLPADTAFVSHRLRQFDAVLAMYHDQGLPVLKHAGFGRAVNVTLGLPFIRTSVDHGTAFDLAGTGRADPGSLKAAVALARVLSEKETADERR